MNENINSNIEWNLVDDTIFVEEHQINTYPYVFETDDITPGSETLQFITPTPTSASMTATYFDVLEVLDNDSTSEDFDFATKYYRGDFGLIELDITEIDTSLYQSFRWILYDFDNDTELLRSRMKPIDELGGGIKVGVRTLGRFRLVLAIFDWYGNMSIVGIPTPITIENRPVNFKIAKHDIEGFYKDLRLKSTMEDRDVTDTDQSFVPDLINETLDINSYDPLTNTPTLPILKRYETKFDIDSIWTRVRELNGISIEDLSGIPVETWGYQWGTIIVDIIGDGTTGTRTLRMKQMEHHSWKEIPFIWASGDDEKLGIQELIEKINSSIEANTIDSIWSKFTYDINWYSNNPDALLSDARPMLRIKAKEEAFTTRRFFFDFSTSFAHSDFTNGWEGNDVLVFSTVDTKNLMYHNGASGASDYFLKVGEFETTGNVDFADADDLVSTLESIKSANDLTTISIFKNDDAVIISCQEDFQFKHAQWGNHIDIFRGKNGTKIHYVPDGSDIKLAEPVYAFLDDDSKMDSAEIIWTLSDALSGETIISQYAQAFRYVITRRGSYTLSCNAIDMWGNTTTTKPGVFLVGAL